MLLKSMLFVRSSKCFLNSLLLPHISTRDYRFTVKEVTSFDKSNSPESNADYVLEK